MEANKNPILHDLKSGMVLDRSLLVAADATVIAQIIANIRANPGKRLNVVPCASEFFTSTNMLNLIKANDFSYVMVAEKAGVAISGAEVAAIQFAEKVSAQIAASMKPKYPFADVPDGWTVGINLSLGPTRIKRKINLSVGPVIHGTQYHLPIKGAEALWAFAAPKWAAKSFAHGYYAVQAHDAKRQVTVHADRVQVGCQTIQRFELEQLARHRNWTFPEAAA